MHIFWLVLTYDLLEDRCIDDIIIKTFFNSLLYKKNRFQVAVRLLSNRSQRTSKCGKSISDTISCATCATFLFLPHFDVLCDLLLNRCSVTWNLYVKQCIPDSLLTCMIQWLQSLKYCLWFVCFYFFSSYIKLYGRKFSKEDHLHFIHIFFELVTAPNLDPQYVIAFGHVLILLLK